jgi:hypothetical protein
MTPLAWGFVLGVAVWFLDLVWMARKRRRQARSEALARAGRTRQQQAAQKRARQEASKARVKFPAVGDPPEREPVVLKLDGDEWSEVWLGDTVAFQNTRTGEILQDGEEFAKLQGAS